MTLGFPSLLTKLLKQWSPRNWYFLERERGKVCSSDASQRSNLSPGSDSTQLCGGQRWAGPYLIQGYLAIHISWPPFKPNHMLVLLKYTWGGRQTSLCVPLHNVTPPNKHPFFLSLSLVSLVGLLRMNGWVELVWAARAQAVTSKLQSVSTAPIS